MTNHLSLKRLRTRLVLAFVGMVFISGFSLAVFAGTQFQEFVYAQAESELMNETLSLTSSLTETLEHLDSARGSSSLQNYLYEEAIDFGGSITVLDANGELIMSTAASDKIEANGQEVISAQDNIVSANRRMTNHTEMIYVAAPVIYETSRIGIIQLATPTTQEQAQIQQQWIGLLVTVFVVTVFAFLLASWLAVTMTRPLGQLQSIVAKYAGGDLSERFKQKAPYEIQTLGDDFNSMAQELQSMIDEQRLFASNASHELRTPLASMKVRTELLLSDELDSKTEEQYLREVDEEVTRLGGLIEDLFLLSRIDSDRLEVGHEQVDVRRLAHAVVHTMQPRIEQKQLDFELEIRDDLPSIQANTNHIRTILRNIVDNAIKYTPDGGTIRWNISQNAYRLCISVTDSGIGIDTDDLAKITNRFYRADQAHSRTISGHGLGMSLVESITVLYGGELTIQSEGEGKGTEVRVELPLLTTELI